MSAFVESSSGPVALVGQSMTIGRLDRNDVPLNDESVSRLHAVLELRSGTWCLRDMHSRNGTWVNGERLHVERALRDGDEVRIGAVRLVFRTGVDAPDLTRHERDVLNALFRSDGEPASTREIAMALVVTEAAVKQHLLNLYRKFDIAPSAADRRRLLLDEAVRRGALEAV